MMSASSSEAAGSAAWWRAFQHAGWRPERSPAVEGWLPIMGMMNTSYFLQTLSFPAIHVLLPDKEEEFGTDPEVEQEEGGLNGEADALRGVRGDTAGPDFFGDGKNAGICFGVSGCGRGRQ